MVIKVARHLHDLTQKAGTGKIHIVLFGVAPSSRGLGLSPFKAATGVRIPVGLPKSNEVLVQKDSAHVSGVFYLEYSICFALSATLHKAPLEIM